VIALAIDDRSSFDLLTRARARNDVVEERTNLFTNDDRLSHLVVVAYAFNERLTRSHYRVAFRTTLQHRDELATKRVREE